MKQTSEPLGGSELVIVWRYRVSGEHAVAFARAYGPAGDWARLFASAEGYRGTELLRADDDGCYVTIDRWASRSHWEAFMAEHREGYERLDAELAPLTELQELVVRGLAAPVDMDDGRAGSPG